MFFSYLNLIEYYTTILAGSDQNSATTASCDGFWTSFLLSLKAYDAGETAAGTAPQFVLVGGGTSQSAALLDLFTLTT